MAEEGGYGGKIVVRSDGSCLWQVASREFPANRDTDGTLEYAIRVVTSERNVITSKNGKCLVNVDQPDCKPVDQPRYQKFLIVSGYETPAVKEYDVVVGQSYFITAGQYPLPEKSATDTIAGTHEHENIPCYDVTLRYDDYDLQRAGLPLDLEPENLDLCYQNRVSVLKLWEAVAEQPPTEQDEASGSPARAELNIGPPEREALQRWAKVERYLSEAGFDAHRESILTSLFEKFGQLADELAAAGSTTNVEHPEAGQTTDEFDFVVSRWLPVLESDKDGTSGSETDGLNEVREVLAGWPIIAAEHIHEVQGSRAITAKGLKHQGTFALMYHGAHRLKS